MGLSMAAPYSHQWGCLLLQVALPDGQVRPCLVPVACLINHSACPHAVRFSTVSSGARPAGCGRRLQPRSACWVEKPTAAALGLLGGSGALQRRRDKTS